WPASTPAAGSSSPPRSRRWRPSSRATTRPTAKRSCSTARPSGKLIEARLEWACAATGPRGAGAPPARARRERAGSGAGRGRAGRPAGRGAFIREIPMRREIEFLNPPELMKPVGFSHAAQTRGGRTLFLAGQVAKDRDGRVVGKGDMVAQFRQVCENLKTLVAA